MCLAVPGKIISKEKDTAVIDINGNKQKINCQLLDIKVGDYVIVQNGFAVRKINEKEAQEILNLINDN